MKKISLLACFLLFVTFFSSLNAQITIGTGTAFSEKYPFNGFYKYSWSNVIYLSSEINTSGSLTSVAFYVDNSPVNYVMNNQKIYARHTLASTITGTNYPTTDGFTLVYDGTVTYNGTGWKTINLTTPFLYNGTSNIEFLFENKAGTYTTGFPYFRYTSTPSGTVNYRLKRDYYDTYFPTDCPAYCGSINNIPNIKLTIQPCTFNVGNIVASSSLVVPGNQTTLSITGQDPTASIQWQSSIDNINFKSISGATSTSFTDNINVTTYYRALLTTNSCTKISSTSTVTADLSSMIVKSIGNGTSATQNYPFNHLYNYNWSNMIYKASEINSSGKLSRIAVNVANSPVNVIMPNQKIWVRHTTSTSYPNATYPTSSGFTLVYDGSISYNGTGWKEIVLNGNFYYNGTDNLEFLFENRSGLYAPYYPTFSYESGTQAEYRVRKDNLDASFPVAGSTTAIYSKNLMNIQLKFIPCSLNAGTISSSSSTFCSGTSSTLTLTNQTSGSSIQWQTSSDNVTWTNTGNPVSTSNTTLIITNQSTTKYYRAIVSLNGCTATTLPQTLTFTPASVAGILTLNGSSSYCSTSNSTTINLSGNIGTVQWQSSSLLNPIIFNDIVGATNSSLTLTNLAVSSNYRAISTNGVCTSAISPVQTIEVNPITAGTLTTSPSTILQGQSSNIVLNGQTAGSSIQWQYINSSVPNYTTISGQSSTTLLVNSVQETTTYKAIVTNNTCTVTTNEVTLTVDASNLIISSIGNGTLSTEKYPFNGNYDYSWTSTIYKASEIKTSGSLTRISFYVNNSPVNETMNNQKIYVRHTRENEQINLNYPTTQGFTLVYDGSITYNGTGWKEIVLQTPFIYNGLDNLEFLFENRDGSFSSNFPTFYYESGLAEYRTKRDYKLGFFPTANSGFSAKYTNILNIKMKFIPCTTETGIISTANPSVAIGSPINLLLTGQEPTATIQWQKSWDNVNFDIIAGQTSTTCTLPMISSTLYLRAVVTNGCSQFTNVLSIEPNSCFSTTASIGTNSTLSTDKYPFNGFYNNSWVSVIYKSSELGQAGKLASASFNVVNTPVNFVMNNQRIYARHTTKTEYLDSIYPDTIGFKLIFDGSITYNGSGWKEIPFTVPFDYNGTSNLEFLFENRDGSWGTGYPMFGYSDNQDGYRVKRDYRDTDFPVLCENCRRFRNVPNIKIKFLPPANIGGTISATETEVCSGKTSVLSVSGQISGSSIQWQSSINNIDFINLLNQLGDVFVLNNLQSDTYYRVIYSQNNCTYTSPTILIKNSCNTINASFSEASGKGNINVDISNIPNKVAPFNYFISQNSIPDLNEVYHFIKDSIYSDTLPPDSLMFFSAKTFENQFSFESLKIGEYYVSVFDNVGERIFDRKINVEPNYKLLNNSTAINNGNLITTQSNNVKNELNILFDENSNSSISFTPLNTSQNQYFGLVSDEINFQNIIDINYGFNISNNGNISIIENGVETNITNTLPNLSELKMVVENTTLYFVINNQVLKSTELAQSFLMKSVFSTESLNTQLKISAVDPILPAEGHTYNPSRDNFSPTPIDTETPFDDDNSPTFSFHHHNLLIKPQILNNFNCDGVLGTFNFTLFDKYLSLIKVAFTIKNDQNQVIYSSGNNLNPFGTFTIPNNIINNPGEYTITVYYRENNIIYPPVASKIFIGFESNWDNLWYSQYNLTPNNYSLSRKIRPLNLPIYSSIKAKNNLGSTENGTITFKTNNRQPMSDFFTITTLNSNNSGTPSNNDTYIRFTNYYSKYLLVELFSPQKYSSKLVSISKTIGNTYYIDPNSKIKIVINSTDINVYVNDDILPLTCPRPPGTLSYKANSKYRFGGFLNVLCSFSCTYKQSLSTIGYFELKKDYSSGYATAVQGKVKFTFDEEYKVATNKYLQVNIFDDNHKLLVQSDINGNITDYDPNTNLTTPSTELNNTELKYYFDDNRYTLTISNIQGILVNRYYYLEATTSTGDKRYLRIFYKY